MPPGWALSRRMVGPPSSSMVKEKSRAVDQSPGDVLRGGEPARGGLLDAHLDVLAELGQFGVNGHGLLGGGEAVAELLEFRVGGEWRLALGEGLGARPVLRVSRAEV